MISLEETVKGLEKWLEEPLEERDGALHFDVTIVRDALEHLRAQQWVSVGDRLPEFGDMVLCLCDNGQVAQGAISQYSFGKVEIEYVCSGPACYGDSPTVTHWMPLPTTPGESDGR